MVLGLSNPFELLAVLALKETLNTLAIIDDLDIDQENIEMGNMLSVDEEPIDLDPVAEPPGLDEPENRGNDIITYYPQELRAPSAPLQLVEPSTSAIRFYEMYRRARMEPQSCDDGVFRTIIAMMKQFLVAQPNRFEAPLTMVFNNDAPGCSKLLSIRANSDFSQEGNSAERRVDATSVVWRSGELILDALFGTEKNPDTWKRGVVSEFMPHNIDSNEVLLLEQPSGRIEMMAANLTQGSRQFLCLLA